MKAKVFCVTNNGRMKLKATNILDAIKEVNSSPYFTSYGVKPLRLVLEECTEYGWREEWEKQQ